MLKFLDGPAKDVVLGCVRAPFFIRVVTTDAGSWDALDQLADKPESGEMIHVYYQAENRGTCHVHGRDNKGRRFGRWYQIADYRLFSDQPGDEVVRDQAAWRDWCQARFNELKEKRAQA